MNISHLNVGIIHSLIGKNDGVSIVIDQTVHAMVNDMGIELGNIFFLAAHTSPRFNAETDDLFWHKNEIHKEIIRHFCTEPPAGFDERIHDKAMEAKQVIANWVSKHNIDLIIAHNTSHPYNFITAVGLGYYIEEMRARGIVWPKMMVWWHDSYFERDQFAHPNDVIRKYLRFLPGSAIDGIAFINQSQPCIAKKLFQSLGHPNIEAFFENRTIVVPNTSSIDWDWKSRNWDGEESVTPPRDNYNDTFLADIGLLDELDRRGFSVDEAVLLLQHTRVVPRKKIETAIDFAFRLEKRYLRDGHRKCIVLLVSGHSGDEQVEYKTYLNDYYRQQVEATPDAQVVLLFGEDRILSHRDIIVDRKYYSFYEIPAIVAALGGLGTYFSEVEGFGNNLLEMVSFGVPAVINRYDIYKTDIDHLGFQFPSIENNVITDEAVEASYRLLTDARQRNRSVKHNLDILHQKLDHRIIAEKLRPLIGTMFTRILNLN